MDRQKPVIGEIADSLRRRGIIIVGPQERDKLRQAIRLTIPETLKQSPPSRQQKRHAAFQAAFKRVSKDFTEKPRAWRRQTARVWCKRPRQIQIEGVR